MKFRRLMDSPEDLTTLIGEGAEFTGERTGKGNFVIFGHVNGDCTVDGSLTVAVEGEWKGTINAINIVIAGQVDGDVNAMGQLEVAASARVKGKLSATSIAVADGAVIEGSIKVTGHNELQSFSGKRHTDEHKISADSEMESASHGI